MSNYVPDRIAFIDTETLGSDRPTTPIIEIAVTITDFNLRILQEKSWLLPRALNDVQLRQISPVVIEMHARNGLWRDLLRNQPAQSASHAEIGNDVARWIRHTAKGYQRVLVAGSGFDHFDRPIIELQMPALADILTYYSLDIGTAERIMRIVGGHTFMEIPTDHRAQSCVRQQVERMRNFVGIIQRALGTPTEQNVLRILAETLTDAPHQPAV